MCIGTSALNSASFLRAGASVDSAFFDDPVKSFPARPSPLRSPFVRCSTAHCRSMLCVHLADRRYRRGLGQPRRAHDDERRSRRREFQAGRKSKERPARHTRVLRLWGGGFCSAAHPGIRRFKLRSPPGVFRRRGLHAGAHETSTALQAHGPDDRERQSLCGGSLELRA